MSSETISQELRGAPVAKAITEELAGSNSRSNLFNR